MKAIILSLIIVAVCCQRQPTYLVGKIGTTAQGANSWLSSLACNPAALGAQPNEYAAPAPSTVKGYKITSPVLGLLSGEMDAIVTQTNVIRNKIATGGQACKVGNCPIAATLPIVTRDSDLECSTLRWANWVAGYGKSQHSQQSSVATTMGYRNSMYVGENMAWSASGGPLSAATLSGSFATTSWVNEQANVRTSDVTTFTVGSYMEGTVSKVIGHWTPLVWQTVTMIGCSAISGVTTRPSYPYEIYVICQYSGPKNAQGIVTTYAPNMLNNNVYQSLATAPTATTPCCTSTTCPSTPTHTVRGGNVAYPNLCTKP